MEKIISNIDLTIYFSDNKITEIYKYDDCDCDYNYDYFINNHDNYLLNVNVNNIYNDLNKLIFDLNDNINSICSKKILNQFEINKIFLSFNSILSYFFIQQQSNKFIDLIKVENELSNEDVFRKIKFNNNYDENYNRKNIISFIYNLTNTIDNFYNILNNLDIKFEDIERNEAVNKITQYLNNFIFKIFFSTFQKDKDFYNHPHVSVNTNNYNDIFLYYELIKKQFYKTEDFFRSKTKSDFYHRMSLFIIQFLKSISKSLYDSKNKTNVDFLVSSNSFFEGELDNVFLYNKPKQNFCNLLVNENFSFGLVLDKILKFYSRSISFKGNSTKYYNLNDTISIYGEEVNLHKTKNILDRYNIKISISPFLTASNVDNINTYINNANFFSYIKSELYNRTKSNVENKLLIKDVFFNSYLKSIIIKKFHNKLPKVPYINEAIRQFLLNKEYQYFFKSLLKDDAFSSKNSFLISEYIKNKDIFNIKDYDLALGYIYGNKLINDSEINNNNFNLIKNNSFLTNIKNEDCYSEVILNIAIKYGLKILYENIQLDLDCSDFNDKNNDFKEFFLKKYVYIINENYMDKFFNEYLINNHTFYRDEFTSKNIDIDSNDVDFVKKVHEKYIYNDIVTTKECIYTILSILILNKDKISNKSFNDIILNFIKEQKIDVLNFKEFIISINNNKILNNDEFSINFLKIIDFCNNIFGSQKLKKIKI